MLSQVFDNKYVSTAITLGLGLYAALLGPNLPPFVKELFTNTIFRIIVLFLVVVRGNKDPKMAIMIAVAFVLTLDYIYAKSAKETFAAIEAMSNTHNIDYSSHVNEPFSSESDDVLGTSEHSTRKSHRSRKTRRSQKSHNHSSPHSPRKHSNWETVDVDQVQTIESLENDPTYNWNLTEQLENTTEYSVSE
jgi:hypothetical protein